MTHTPDRQIVARSRYRKFVVALDTCRFLQYSELQQLTTLYWSDRVHVGIRRYYETLISSET